MGTLHIRANQEVIDRILEFVRSFQQQNLEISVEPDAFFYQQKYLHEQVQALDSGNVTFCSVEELDAKLEETLLKYKGKNLG
jgi:heme oxygenase